MKAYRQLDDEWYDYSPRKAADVLELASEDYEVDGERSALLLRRLPPGLPESAREALYARLVSKCGFGLARRLRRELRKVRQVDADYS